MTDEKLAEFKRLLEIHNAGWTPIFPKDFRDLIGRLEAAEDACEKLKEENEKLRAVAEAARTLYPDRDWGDDYKLMRALAALEDV